MVISRILENVAAACRPGTEQRERGAVYVEYGLLLVLIAVFCLMALSSLGGETTSLIADTATSVAEAGD